MGEVAMVNVDRSLGLPGESAGIGPTVDDVPLWIPSREDLGAVVTVPPEGSHDLGVVLMSGRARDRCHRNGMWVRAATRMAQKGAYVLRLDYPGVGHSSGPPQIFDLESPPVWAVKDACAFLLRETPVSRIVLAGSCFGARVVLHAAPDIDEVVSVAMVAAPVYARKQILRRRIMSFVSRSIGRGRQKRAAHSAQQRREGNLATGRRVSPSFERALRDVTSRYPVYFLYGLDDFVWEELEFALDRLNLSPDSYELDLVPGVIHSFRSLDVQALTIERLSDWCSRFSDSATTT